MNRRELKEYVTQTLLEVVDYPGKVKGKFIKRTLGYSGYERDIVCEGTIAEAREWAIVNELNFVEDEDSKFGGHYDDGTAIYEFHPNPEYYGEMMETNMSARESLSRILGTNDKILAEVDESQITQLVQHILSDETLAESRVAPIFTNISRKILEGIVDPTQIHRLLTFLVKEGLKTLSTDLIEISENENKLAVEQLFAHFKNQIREITEERVECKRDPGSNKPTPFSRTSALMNYKRISGGAKLFL